MIRKDRDSAYEVYFSNAELRYGRSILYLPWKLCAAGPSRNIYPPFAADTHYAGVELANKLNFIEVDHV